MIRKKFVENLRFGSRQWNMHSKYINNLLNRLRNLEELSPRSNKWSQNFLIKNSFQGKNNKSIIISKLNHLRINTKPFCVVFWVVTSPILHKCRVMELIWISVQDKGFNYIQLASFQQFILSGLYTMRLWRALLISSTMRVKLNMNGSLNLLVISIRIWESSRPAKTINLRNRRRLKTSFLKVKKNINRNHS